jgi:hypothetical protein
MISALHSPSSRPRGTRPAAARAAPAWIDAIREAAQRRRRFASARALSHYLEARRQQRAGDTAKWVEHLRLAVTYDEVSPELRVALAAALADKGDLGPSEGEARRALELGASEGTASEVHVLLGQIAVARRQNQRAALAFRTAMRLGRAHRRGRAGRSRAVAAPLGALLERRRGRGGATLDELATYVGDSSGFRLAGALLKRREPGKTERHLRRAVS